VAQFAFKPDWTSLHRLRLADKVKKLGCRIIDCL
jgi:hypothetical protein